MNEFQLFTPGPSKLPPSVMQAMGKQPLYHKSSEFYHLLQRVQIGLQYVFSTENYVIPLSCSGTGAGEAVIKALHKAGDTILVLNNGRFSRRWCSMLSENGVNVVNAAIADSLSFQKNDLDSIDISSTINAVWITHCETSTGALNNLESIIKSIQLKTNALICVDGISSIGCQDCKMDEWGIDALISCSQKGLMVPPGLGFVALSAKAWKIAEQNSSDAYYFNLLTARESIKKNKPLFTPAINQLMAMDVALELIFKEGLDNVISRHTENASLMRSELSNLGYSIYPENPSNSLTVIYTNLANKIINLLKTKHGIIVAEGQDSLHGEIIRIGHMGYYFRQDIVGFLAAFKDVVLTL